MKNKLLLMLFFSLLSCSTGVKKNYLKVGEKVKLENMEVSVSGKNIYEIINEKNNDHEKYLGVETKNDKNQKIYRLDVSQVLNKFSDKEVLKNVWKKILKEYQHQGLVIKKRRARFVQKNRDICLKSEILATDFRPARVFQGVEQNFYSMNCIVINNEKQRKVYSLSFQQTYLKGEKVKEEFIDDDQLFNSLSFQEL